MDSKEKGLIKINSDLLKALNSNAIIIRAFDEDILALESIVAGTSYNNLTEIEKEIKPNETQLALVREPKNKYDTFAVKVLFKDHKLGYIPRDKNQTIARLMDAGKQFYAQTTKKEWEGKWLRMDLKVFLKD